ncbi:hypothetical protein MMC18_008890 [Xylographa bjoerkii]|nr:hypothetical protein [Xylographa bjoerkii]MCJ1395995.1 hypothetical protein [Xylographa bjoerkii]MCJ1396004.1 hypothetical protein [Xylographa bjoerkii]
MNVSNMISPGTPADNYPQEEASALYPEHYHQYPTRRSTSVIRSQSSYPGQPGYSAETCAAPMLTHLRTSSNPKNVAFELRLEGAPNYRARLPMRVQIFPHDTTESIVTTVKNFYGLYEGAANGVSFEDDQGNTLIARYENFRNNMIVYVRVVSEYSQSLEEHGKIAHGSTSPHKRSHLEDVPRMLPPLPAQALHYGQPPSRPASRVSRKQSASPRLGRAQQNTYGQKSRSHSGAKGHSPSFQANLDDLNHDTANGYSSSDGGAASVTSSRKARSEQLASAEISVDNIVEGGRRKRAKFESSELPLFVPPQVPAPNSISSISPQRRSNGIENASPFARPIQRNFAFSVPLQSPQGFAFSDHAARNMQQSGTSFAMPSATSHGHRLRDRINVPTLSTRSVSGTIPRPLGAGILPTPDPTIASCISDEDVALQLMRLGDASNFSHGRTSASTLDDAFSGRADAASSMTSESEDESDGDEEPILPPTRVPVKTESGVSLANAGFKKQRRHLNEILPSIDSTEPSGDEVDTDYEEGVLRSDLDDHAAHSGQGGNTKQHRGKSAVSTTYKARAGSASIKTSKATKAVAGIAKKSRPSSLSTTAQAPISPASLPSQSRKTSSASTINFQHQLGVDEDDLSSKPRCQRCRKSKKGCDRQRPCQRCKDAGIGVDGCVSEDEGNGRKGRYGRHMGVPVKKGSEGYIPDESETAGAILTEMAGAQAISEKSKKRKR